MEQLVHNSKSRYKDLITFTLVYVGIACIFPTLRTLIIGPEGSESILEYAFSVLPTMLIAALLMFSAYLHFNDKIKIKLTLVDWAVITFLVINVILGMILTNDLIIGIYGFRMTYIPVFLYFLFRFLPLEPYQKRWLCSGIFIIMAAVAIIGVILYFIFYNEMVWMIEYTGGIVGIYFKTRMTSIFWTPVVFGTFMMAGFLYAYFRIVNNRNIWWYIAFSIFWLCVLMSGSRGAIGAAVIGFILLLILSGSRRVVIVPLILVTVLFTLNVFYMTDTITVNNAQSKQFNQKQEGKPGKYIEWMVESSVETVTMRENVSRVILWKQAFKNFNQKPLGYGLGRSGHIASRFYDADTEEADVYATDGWFLKIINETGIAGILTYLFFAITFFIMAIKYLRTRKDLLFLFIFVLFIVVNAQNIVSNVLDFFLFAPLFWMLIGLAENIRNYNTHGSRS